MYLSSPDVFSHACSHAVGQNDQTHRAGDPPLGVLSRVAEQLGDRLRGLAGSDRVLYFRAPQVEIRVNVHPVELAAINTTPAQPARRNTHQLLPVLRQVAPGTGNRPPGHGSTNVNFAGCGCNKPHQRRQQLSATHPIRAPKMTLPSTWKSTFSDPKL